MAIVYIDTVMAKTEKTTSVRGYRYAVRLKPYQVAIVDSGLRRKGRSVWNTLVIRTKLALGDYEHGRKHSVARRFAARLKKKKQTGMNCRGLPQVRRSPNFEKLSRTRKEEVMEAIREVRRMRRVRQTIQFRRSAAVEYACETMSTDYASGAVSDIPSQIFHKLIQQYRDSTKLWQQWKPRAGDPRTKRQRSPVSLKVQSDHVPDADNFIDLSAFHPALAKVEVVFHRPLPVGSKVKMIALTATELRTFVILFVEASKAIFEVAFPAKPETVIGVDPGIRTPAAASTLDGEFQCKIEPKNIHRTATHQKRFARLQRKLDRQRRINNPDCYKPDGTWIKGKRAKVTTVQMRRTLRQVALISGKLANRRLESYRLAARDLLARADTIRVGVWRPKRLGGPKTKDKRNYHRKTYDNAIATFASILEDYARRSRHPKTVIRQNEMLTTRTCPDCGAVKPEAIPVTQRVWTCACGIVHDRDIAAARNLANVNFAPPEMAVCGPRTAG